MNGNVVPLATMLSQSASLSLAILSVVSSLAYSLHEHDTCATLQDCGSCVSHKLARVHNCYWCEIDEGCYHVGSSRSPCTPAQADAHCVSQSRFSFCNKTSVHACGADQPTAPTQIHLALAGTEGMRVAWKTARKPADAYVLVSTNMNMHSGDRFMLDRSVQYLATADGATYGWHHVATLTGLSPGRQYHYRVVCDNVTSTMRFFKTVDHGQMNASFLVIGDMGQHEAEASRSRIDALKDSIDVIIHQGDVGYADDAFMHPECSTEFCYESAYDQYMEWMEPVIDNKPYMVAAGNHESECHSPACLASHELKESLRNFTAYNARFAMPSPESKGTANMWYSFDYASVHFVVINTETDFKEAPEEHYGSGTKVLGLKAGHFAPDGAYLKWLEADLKAANEQRSIRPWIVTVGHRPWFWKDGQPHKAESVKKAHADLFKKYGVDLYVAGHLHSYHRLLPINGNKATPFVVAGGAGNDEFSLDQKRLGKWDVKGSNSHWNFRYFDKETSVGILTASPTSLKFEAVISRTGEVFDTMTLQKEPARLSAPIDEIVV